MWDQRYSEPGYAYGTEPNDFLVEQAAAIAEGGRVLCLAEGEGRNAVYLAQLGYAVTAVDQSSVGLNKARKLATVKGTSIDTIVADLAEFELGESAWDAIVSISAHLPPDVRRRLHADVPASLRDGGVLVLEAYTVRHLEMEGVGGPPASQREMFMSLDALREELPGMEFLHARETERVMAEGKYHRGPSATVQVLARKVI